MFVCEYDGYEWYYDIDNDIWTQCVPGGQLVDVDHDSIPMFVRQKLNEQEQNDCSDVDPFGEFEDYEEESTLFDEVGGYGYDIDE